MSAFPAAASCVCIAALVCACTDPTTAPSAQIVDRSFAVTTVDASGTGVTVTGWPVLAGAETAPDDATIRTSTTVALRGLDLRRAPDRLVARKRVIVAARRVCGEPLAHTGREKQAIGECREVAAAGANADLDRRVLALGQGPATEVASAAPLPAQ
jgi:UrcA family protein